MRRSRSRRRRSRPRDPRASYREHHATATRASRYAFAPVPARLASLSFFFPALNEEAHVRAIVDEALAVLPRFAEDLEVTIVDDGSTDRTGAIADEAAARDPRVRVIHHGRRRGYGGAIRSGLLAAKDDWIFYTDGDRQFALEDLGRLIEASGDADAVVGYRIKRADPVRRRFVAWVYNRLIRLLFGGGWRDVDCAVKLLLARAPDHAEAQRNAHPSGGRPAFPTHRRGGERRDATSRSSRDPRSLRAPSPLLVGTSELSLSSAEAAAARQATIR